MWISIRVYVPLISWIWSAVWDIVTTLWCTCNMYIIIYFLCIEKYAANSDKHVSKQAKKEELKTNSYLYDDYNNIKT